MKKNKILSVLLAAAMIVAVAALASACGENKGNSGIVVDLTTAETTTATTKNQTSTTAAQTTAESTTANVPTQTTPTEQTAATVQTTPTTPTEPTIPTSTTAEATTAQTTEATTAQTPIVTPGVLEYDITDAEFGKLHVKVENIDPLKEPAYRKNNQWNDVSKVDLRKECDLIVRASIVSMQEIRISVVGQQLFGTVLTVDILQTYHSKSLPETSRIRVFCELSSHDTTIDAANLYVGGEYYFFLEQVEGNVGNRLGYENFCEYFISLPPNVDYLVPVGASLNDNMIELLENNDRSGFSVDPRYGLGIALEELFG